MKLKRTQNLILFIALGILIISNVLLFRVVHRQISNTSDGRIESITLDLEDDIRDRIEIYSNLLYGVRGAFSASQEVTELEWEEYMKSVDIINRYPGVRSITYAPVINNSSRTQFENAVARKGISNFKIYPDVQTSIVIPSLYVEPRSQDGVARTVGFNIFSDETRKTAVEFARDNNTLSITKKLTLVADDSEHSEPSFVLYLPIYRTGAVVDTVEQRREAFTGVVAAGLRASDFMEGVISDYYKNLDYQIFDASDEGGLQLSNMLYNSGLEDVLKPGYSPKYAKLSKIEWPNSSWYIRYVTSPNFGLTNFEMFLPYIMLVRNLILSLFLLYILRRWMRNRNKIETVKIDFEKCASGHILVDSMEEAIIVTNTTGLITVFNRKAEQILGYKEVEAVGKINILNIVSDDTLQVYSAKIAKELHQQIDPSFDTLVTHSIIEGQDHQKWLAVTKSGAPVNLNVIVKPLYDGDNGLIGYQYNF